jgi:hypothetical protein
MKKYNNIFLTAAFIVSMIFSGCSKEIEEIQIPESIPGLQFTTENIVVKIGTDSKYLLEIKEGGGEYNVFSLDEEVAKVEIIDGVIYIEGLVNGKTSIVVSDKNGFYRKLPVMVYTTETIILEDYNLELTTLLGYSDKITTNVILGNGEYQVSSDNPKVQAKITEDGIITITGTSKLDTFTATVTVTDASGLSAFITLTMKSTTDPYSAEKLAEIMKDNSRRYYIGESATGQNYFTFLNTQENGQQLYGWDYWGYYWFKLWFTGDKSVGKKTNGILSYSYYYPAFDFKNEPVEFEIIKNDGTNLWAIFSFVKDEMLVYGYFCDKI